MKPHRVVCQVSIAAFLFATTCSPDAAGQTSTGWTGSSSNLWSLGGNWDNGAPPGGDTFKRDLFFGTGFVTAGGMGSLTSANDLAGYTGYRITFEDTTAPVDPAFTITGNGFTLAEFAGNAPRIQNDSTSLQTFNLTGSLVLNGTGIDRAEINAVTGDLFFSATTLIDLAGFTELQIGGNNGKTVTFDGVISSSGGANGLAVKQNSTVVLNAANTYAGTTSVEAGVLNVRNSGALGSATAGTIVSAGAALELQGGVTIAGESLTLNGHGVSNGGALRNVSGDNTWAGPVILASASRIHSEAGTLIFDQSGAAANVNQFTGAFPLTISGPGNVRINDMIAIGAGTLTKEGSGTLTLNATGSSFTGAVNISGGVLEFAAVSGSADQTALGTGAKDVTLTNGGVLRPLTTADPSMNTKRFIVGAGGGTFDTPAGVTFTLNDANQFQGDGTLTKTGAGTFVAGGSTSFTGVRSGATLINEGIINLSNAGGLGTGAVTLNAGGTLNVTQGNQFNNPLIFNGGTIAAVNSNAVIGGTITVKEGTTTTVSTSEGTGARIVFTRDKIIGSGDILVTGRTDGTRSIMAIGSTLTEATGADAFTGTLSIGRSTTVELFPRHSGPLGTASVTTGSVLGAGTVRFVDQGVGTLQGLVQFRDAGEGIANNQTMVRPNAIEVIEANGEVNVGNASITGAFQAGHKFVIPKITIGEGRTLTASSSFSFILENSGLTSLLGDATINNGAETILSGVVSGPASLTKTGSGVLTLGGNANTFGGAGKTISVNAGVLAFGSDGAFGHSANAISVSGATLRALSDLSTSRAITLAGAGTFDVLSGATFTLESAVSGANALTKSGLGALRTTVSSGNPFGEGNHSLSGGALEIVPVNTGGAVALGGANTAVASTFTYGAGTSLVLNKNGNTDLTYTVGNVAAAANTAFVRGGGATLTIVPSALANLGVSEKFVVNGGLNQSNGTVSPSIVARTAANSSATFLSYGANGFVPVAYDASNSQSGQGINAADPAANFLADQDANLTANKTLNSLRIDNTTVSGAAGTTLTLSGILNPTGAGTGAGIILNGGTLSVPTIAAGGSEVIAYTSAANGTISSNFTSTGGFTKHGPGNLSVEGRLPSGTLNVNDGKVTTLAPFVIAANSAVNLNNETTLDLAGSRQMFGSLSGSAAAQIINSGSATDLVTSSSGDTTFSGAIGGDIRLIKLGGSMLTLGGAAESTYTGGTIINAGTVNVGSFRTLGTGDVTVLGAGRLTMNHPLNVNTAGGAKLSLQANSLQMPVLTLVNNFLPPIEAGSAGVIAVVANNTAFQQVNAIAGTNLFLGATGNGDFTVGGLNPGLGSTYRLGGGGFQIQFTAANALTGSNNLVIGAPSIAPGTAPANGSGTVAIRASNTVAGTALVNSGSTLLLNTSSSVHGQLNSITAFTVAENAALRVDNTPGVNGTRIADTAAIQLAGGTFDYRGEDNGTTAGNGSNVAEVVGQLSFSGPANLIIRNGHTGGSTATTSLTFASLNTAARAAGDTLSVQSVNIGGGTAIPLAATNRIIFTAAPASTNGIIAPWLVDQSTGDYLTHGANGLTTATYNSTDITASGPNSVVNQTTEATVPANATAYAAKVSAALTGGKLSLGSGGAIFNGTATHSTNFDFGQEGIVYVGGGITATLSGAVNAGAFTKFGPGTLTLGVGGTNNNNSVDLANADLKVNAGLVLVGNAAGTDIRNVYQVGRVNIASGATFGHASVTFSPNIVMGTLSGAGTLKVGTNNSGGVTSTFINQTEDAIFTGSISLNVGRSSLFKNGSASLTLINNFQITDTLQINAGTVTITSGAAMTNAQTDRQRLYINQGGTLNVDNSVVNNNDRFNLTSGTSNGGAFFRVGGGTFNFTGNALVPTSELMGHTTANGRPQFDAGASTINLVADPAQPLTLTFGQDLNRNAGASPVIRGTNLGAVNGAGVAQFKFNNTPTLVGGAGAGAQTSIFKGVIGNSVSGATETLGLTTYDTSTGVRLLTAAETAATFTSGSSALVNVKNTGAIAGIDAATTINALHIGSGGSIAGTGTLTINSGTVLAADNGVAGSNSISTAGLAFGGSEAIFHTASDLSVSSLIAGTGGFTKGGGGTLTLTNAGNTFSGGQGVTVNGGLLSVSTNGQLGATGNVLRLNNGGGLQGRDTFTTNRGIVLGAASGTVDVTSGATVTASGVISGGISASSVSANNMTVLNSEADTTVFRKTGAGTLALTAANTYIGGTIVEGGTLLVNNVGGSATGTGPVSVAPGATLGGDGQISGAVTVSGTLAPGNSAGQLDTGSLTFASTATFSIEIGGTIPGLDYDQVSVAGGISLAGNLVGSLFNGFNPQENADLFFIMLNDGDDAVLGTFNGLAQGATLTFGAQQFLISYNADFASSQFSAAGGNDVALMAVPEPGTVVSLFIGVGSLLGLQRFRRSARVKS